MITAQKDIINILKRQPTKRVKMFVDHISDNELISILYKELQVNHHNKNNLVQKWAQDFNGHFSEEDDQ